MKQASAPSRLDVSALAHTGERRTGHDLLLNYERLTQEAQAPFTEMGLDWSIQGEFRNALDGLGQVWLHLTVNTALPLTCQRCLGLVETAVAVDQWYRFVEGQEAADAQDDASEEDVLALSREFNLAALIEDEVLLALPLIPRHVVCPVPVKLAAVDPAFDAAMAEKRHPFAVLSKLHGGKAS